MSRDRYVPPYAIALVHAGLGDRDAAFDWLRRGLTVRDVHLIFLTVDPKWDAYRSDSRFTALLSDCGFVRNRATLAPQQGHDRRWIRRSAGRLPGARTNPSSKRKNRT